MNYKFVIPIVVFVIAVTAWYGWREWQQLQLDEQRQKAAEQAAEVEGGESISDEEVDEVDSSEWQTYRNEEYGFEFQYDSQWPGPQIITTEPGATMTVSFGPYVTTWSDAEKFQVFALDVFSNKNKTKFVVESPFCDRLAKEEACFQIGSDYVFNADVIVNDYSDVEQMKKAFLKEFDVNGLPAYATVIGAESPITYVRIEGTEHGFDFRGLLHYYDPGDEFYAVVNSFKEIK